MTSNEILKADMLDILFDNRNKQYGAYVLRKTYNGRLGAALAVSLSSMLLLFFVLRINNSSKHPRPSIEKNVVVIHDLRIPLPKKAEPIIPPKTSPLPQVRTQKLTTIKIEDDNKVRETVPDQRTLLTSAISNVKLDGINATNVPVIKEQVATTELKEDPKPIAKELPAQKEPEFPGGPDAWLNFLRKNLFAPSELQPGETKTVAIRFDVSEEGLVTNFHVVKSAGSIFDNEVIRVLKKMPKWKPAIQNGQPVSRAFTQPVTFMGAEE